jgi:hypothetical protein
MRVKDLGLNDDHDDNEKKTAQPNLGTALHGVLAGMWKVVQLQRLGIATIKLYFRMESMAA